MAASTLDAFQVIADLSRRQMLRLLSKDRLTISSLAEHFEMNRPAVPKHVKILHGVGFVSIECVGRQRYGEPREDGF